ncbi:hypothetical protein Lste_1885 [Legionella steelei]|uniref:Uncharacterized protein n=1 Tax=Legionella steelei TaxID=947033 RepID=A0A0W0ZI23_9GAMM|nr:hypothetical protein Lste_1885 [Legionella steelei]
MRLFLKLANEPLIRSAQSLGRKVFPWEVIPSMIIVLLSAVAICLCNINTECQVYHHMMGAVRKFIHFVKINLC